MDKDVIILIPALEPDDKLVSLCQELKNANHSCLVINDGSSPKAEGIFNQLRQMNIPVLVHAVNLGKGQALKTGFNHCLTEYGDELIGVVTADADGQHLPKDIISVANNLRRERSTLWIGSRSFDKNVPWKSQFGNTLTRHIFHLLIGQKLFDTQSGLRGIPTSFMPRLMKINATGYEYELDMLAIAANNKVRIKETPIETVYIENNRASHFHPLFDSLRVYFVFVRFCGLSLITALLDFIVFTLAFLVYPSILSSIVLARFVAGTFNFLCGKRYIFKSEQSIVPEATKFALLVFALGVISFTLIQLMSNIGMNVFVSKVLVETALFLLSFSAQRILVFRQGHLAQGT